MSKAVIAFLLIIFEATACAEIIIGKVVSVTDGDTITLLDTLNTQHKIRLAGIDAPEKTQAFGNVSKKSLSELVYGKQVTVEWQKNDQYGRIVGKVVTNDIDVNHEQIKRGMAWFYKRFKNEMTLKDRLEYTEAEEYARLNNLGLWTDDNAVPPWDFRKRK